MLNNSCISITPYMHTCTQTQATHTHAHTHTHRHLDFSAIRALPEGCMHLWGLCSNPFYNPVLQCIRGAKSHTHMHSTRTHTHTHTHTLTHTHKTKTILVVLPGLAHIHTHMHSTRTHTQAPIISSKLKQSSWYYLDLHTHTHTHTQTHTHTHTQAPNFTSHVALPGHVQCVHQWEIRSSLLLIFARSLPSACNEASSDYTQIVAQGGGGGNKGIPTCVHCLIENPAHHH